MFNQKSSGKDYRQIAQDREEELLCARAALSKNHQRRDNELEDYRLPYKRDVDAIVHSKAYARYGDKTQVVYLIDHDHITQRSLHVQLVSNFSRGIAEILRLNVDLVEAIALGHDVGHPPFGHEGEGYLSELSIEYGQGPFAHPLQSCRLFTAIEPLNLGLAVYDGFLCHDGGMCGNVLVPRFGKTWADHVRDKEHKKSHPDENIMPGTLEGCLVKLCDTISYLGRDIEDAIKLGIITREQVPHTVLGVTNQEILAAVGADMIHHSFGKEHIAVSEEVYDALKALRRFNFTNIYFHPTLKTESKKIKGCYRLLFEWLLENHESEAMQSHLWNNYLHNKNEQYLAETPEAQKVIDYLAGMTNHYFMKVLDEVIIPQKIQLS